MSDGDAKAKARKARLDVLLTQRGLVKSRHRAKGLILAGEVRVNGKRLSKAGAMVPEDAAIEVTGKEIPYVSRGGVKLEAALREFEIDVAGLTCLDVGASTGGFTDCLLQHGANHVVAVDVGYGQLDWKLRSDPRVRVIERTNIRYLDAATVGEALEFACIDVSFISLKIVVPAVLKFLKRPGRIVCLIKPQFEVGKALVPRGGVVRDTNLHDTVIEDLTKEFTELGLRPRGVIPSPILGPKGNQEYLAYFDVDLSPVMQP